MQASGWAYRLQRQYLHEEFARAGALQHWRPHDTQTRLTLAAQTAFDALTQQSKNDLVAFLESL